MSFRFRHRCTRSLPGENPAGDMVRSGEPSSCGAAMSASGTKSVRRAPGAVQPAPVERSGTGRDS